MIGNVDSKGRALLEIPVARDPDATSTSITAWVDTAFDGHLVFAQGLIDELNLETLVETEAILADGSRVLLDTYLCYVDWFGTRRPIQAIANEGKFPLLGTGLLDQRVLRVDYIQRRLSLD